MATGSVVATFRATISGSTEAVRIVRTADGEYQFEVKRTDGAGGTRWDLLAVIKRSNGTRTAPVSQEVIGALLDQAL